MGTILPVNLDSLLCCRGVESGRPAMTATGRRAFADGRRRTTAMPGVLASGLAAVASNNVPNPRARKR